MPCGTRTAMLWDIYKCVMQLLEVPASESKCLDQTKCRSEYRESENDATEEVTWELKSSWATVSRDPSQHTMLCIKHFIWERDLLKIEFCWKQNLEGGAALAGFRPGCMARLVATGIC